MDTNNYLKDMLIFFAARGVRLVIGGGVAVVLHGGERMTMDLDIALDMEPKNVQRFLGAVEELEMVPRAPIPPETLLDQAAIEHIIAEKQALVFTFIDLKNPFKQIDIFLTQEHCYDVLVKDSVPLEIEGHQLRVVSPDKLIEMKKSVHPMRTKDLMDIHMLTALKENFPL